MQCSQKTDELIPEVLEFLEQRSEFVIVGHKEPDGDCIGSQLALSRYLLHKGKTVYAVSAGPFLRTEVKRYESFFKKELPCFSKDTALIVVDCSNLDRTGFDNAFLPDTVPMLFIDHHASGNPEGHICFVNAHAPATAFLVQEIIEASGFRITQEIAELLFFSIVTDTGFFRHLEQGSGRYFDAIARLVDAGASPKKAFYAMNGGKTLANRKLLGELLLNTKAYFDNKLLLSSLALHDQERYGLESRDSDMLYQLLMTVEECEAVAVIRQETEDYCAIGLRSKEWIDVGKITEQFGGGGHKHAAGAYVQGTIETLKRALLKEFEKLLT